MHWDTLYNIDISCTYFLMALSISLARDMKKSKLLIGLLSKLLILSMYPIWISNHDRTLISQVLYLPKLFFFRPVRVIRFISEETIEEGIYSIAQEKLKLEQDLTNSDGDELTTKKKKKDVSRLLKLALDVDIAETELGDVNKVYTDTDTSKSYVEL